MRLSTALVCGPQLKRWYSAELPNSSSDVAMKTAHAHFAGAPWATRMRTMPATIATGKVPAWIQPRHEGLISTFASTAAASISGSSGTSGAAALRAAAHSSSVGACRMPGRGT